jgi:hypothetical protein
MENQEFQRRRESAISKLRQQIDRINGVTNSKLLDVYDTGVGSPEHTYQANQRAKANGQVLRESGVITSTLYDYIKDINRCSDDTELWQWLQGELMPRAVYKEEGGIDWPKWWSAMRDKSLDSKYNRAYGKALQDIYSCFWV